MARLINLANFEQFAAINLTADPGYNPSDRRIPNCAQIVLNWTSESGKGAHNVLHGSYNGAFAGSQTQANAIVAALTTGAQWTALASFIGGSAGLGSVSIRDLNVVDSPIIPSIAGGGAGSSASPPLPNEVALVVTLRTAFTGPQNRGRMYIPDLATNALAAGNIASPACVTAVTNWASIIAGVLSAQGYTFGIGHYSRLAYVGVGGRQHPARPAGVVPITTVSVRDNHWDTQRRRGLK